MFPPHRSAYTHPSRPTYLPSQLEAYPSYLSAAYSSFSSSSLSTQSSADALTQQQQQQNIPHKTANERSHSMSSLTNGHHHLHHPYPMKEKEPKSAGPRLIGNEDVRCLNGSTSLNNNNNNNNFKVPSGKEGSLKHRILTTQRPHDGISSKYGTINHPANRWVYLFSN